MADEQAEVLRFLENGGLGGPARRIDTHGAIVLLVGEHAYKIKRAVRFSFMDYGTLDKREQAVRAELDLNRRTAPMLYRRVLAVTREADGSLALEGKGTPVEWVLEMVRFPDEAQLDRVAERGELDLTLVERLADTVFRFHAEAPVRADQGGYAAMREVTRGNAGDLADLASDLLDAGAVEALNQATRAELERQVDLLEARRRAGLVRHCHGDLHLANIVLLDGNPVLFDAIEFDERIACTDVLYDLAFLVMDLLERRLRPQAWTLLQAYVELSGYDAGLALLPLFLSVRAAVRAKVAGFNARVLEGEARTAKVEAAEGYLRFAQQALEPVPPRLLVVAGRSGTGKSTLARRLAPSFGAMPGALLVRSDIVRKQLAGVPPSERLPAEAYAPERTEAVFQAIERHAAALLQAGRTVIADAVYGEAWQRHGIEAVAARLGVPFGAVWLEAPEAVLESRVEARKGDASDADLVVVRAQRERLADVAVTWPRVDAGRPLGETAAEVRRVWEG